MDMATKRKTYEDRIARLQESHDMSQDGAHRAYCVQEIELEQRLLARLSSDTKEQSSG